MTTPKNPKDMDLGEIVRELNLLNSVRTLSVIVRNEQAYTRAPSYCKNSTDLFRRKDQPYSELNTWVKQELESKYTSQSQDGTR